MNSSNCYNKSFICSHITHIYFDIFAIYFKLDFTGSISIFGLYYLKFGEKESSEKLKIHWNTISCSAYWVNVYKIFLQ